MSAKLLLAAHALVGVAMLAVAMLCALFALTEYDQGERLWAWLNLVLAALFLIGGGLMLRGY